MKTLQTEVLSEKKLFTNLKIVCDFFLPRKTWVVHKRFREVGAFLSVLRRFSLPCSYVGAWECWCWLFVKIEARSTCDWLRLQPGLKLIFFEVPNIEVFSSNSSPGNFGRHLPFSVGFALSLGRFQVLMSSHASALRKSLALLPGSIWILRKKKSAGDPGHVWGAFASCRS